MTMTAKRAFGLFLLTAVAFGSGALGAADQPKVKYPEGYRSWLHLKSMVIHDKSHPLFEAFGGIHHVYVNPRGAKVARSGGTYPDGTVLVFDLLEAKSEGGATTEGSRKFVGVMEKNGGAYAATGGWGFEAFKGDTKDQRVVTDAKTQCFACHQSRQASGYVFSTHRP
jgi:hypothetical protein